MFKIYMITEPQKSFEANFNRVMELDSLKYANQIGVQIRFPNFDERDVFEFSKRLKSSVKNLKLLINESIDIMEILKLDGVHLKSRSIPTQIIKKYLSSYLIGKSTHSIDEIEDFKLNGGDFVTFGPIFDTLSKRGMGQPLGIESLKKSLNIKNIPIFPLGGINSDNIEQIKKIDVHNIAGIGLFFLEPFSKVEKILSDFLNKKKDL